jgi:hypothetical protein
MQDKSIKIKTSLIEKLGGFFIRPLAKVMI